MSRTLLTLLLCLSIFYSGCGGRDAHPVAAYQPGDADRSCEGLRLEVAQMEADIAAKGPKANKTPKNVLCFVTGFLVIVPWFFMDLKNADKTELEAMKTRSNRLTLLAAEKNCDIKVPQKQ
jgi:hypothetical protein